ncbi:DUF6538 domain-containing protein [Aquisalimonas asiatica]|uniref:DUF6538 domain-containing protein n=1 Tax=Aquisalimonas asiatica TaxID=406100 RepID=UPI003CCB79A1
MTVHRAPSFLLHRPSGWYFRYVAPHRLRPSVGLSELKVSLRTRSKVVAKSRARRLAVISTFNRSDIRGEVICPKAPGGWCLRMGKGWGILVSHPVFLDGRDTGRTDD